MSFGEGNRNQSPILSQSGDSDKFPLSVSLNPNSLHPQGKGSTGLALPWTWNPMHEQPRDSKAINLG